MTRSNSDRYRFPHGWEEYVVLEAAVRCFVKEGKGLEGLAVLLTDVRQRILEEVRGVNQNAPATTLVQRI